MGSIQKPLKKAPLRFMPTLLKNAGVQFLQLGCNPASQYPRFPELFWWEGPGGSKLLCNYTSVYGSDIRPTANWPCKNYLAMQMNRRIIPKVFTGGYRFRNHLQ